MSGNKIGGRKAAETNLKKYGKNFYVEIGRKGGSNGHTGGFNSDKVGKDGLTGRERAKIAGAKGGSISKRGPAKHSATKTKKVAPKTEPNTTPVTEYHVKEQKITKKIKVYLRSYLGGKDV